jgi:hypothetical protein
MSNETKQTPIEKFIEKLEEIGDLRDCTSIGLIQLNIDKKEYIELKRQAKEVEKQKIKKTYIDCLRSTIINPLGDEFYEPLAEEYYQNEFGGDK